MRSSKIFLFILTAVALLALLCLFFPADGVKLFGITLRFPSLERIMTREEKFNMDAFLSDEQRRQDSIAKVLSDSTDYYIALLNDSATRFYLPDDNFTFFDAMFATMDSAQHQQRTVRVLHYGDSQVEMDHMTSRLRSALQEQFGGGGPGLLPLNGFTPVTAAQIWANGSYEKLSSFGDSTVSRSSGNYGPMMQCHRINGAVSAGIRPAAHRDSNDRILLIDHLRVLFNNRGGTFSASLDVPDAGYSQAFSSSAEGVQHFDWQLDSIAAKISLHYSGSADFYGIMADYGHGVAVDNIPMRGCSGHQFKGVRADLLTAAYSQMDVALIILQFGGNSVPYIRGEKALERYCEELGEQIDHLHACCPNATILFIGPSDMTSTGEGTWQTWRFLPNIVEGLRQMANQHGAAYWSIYDAMGGWNSMKSWVDNGYAGKDYMHFTQKGADIMGDRLAQALLLQYEYYKFRQRGADFHLSDCSSNNPKQSEPISSR